MEIGLHHVALPVRDLDRALAFYRDVLGLKPIERPDFPFAGAWLSAGSCQIHLIVNTTARYQPSVVDSRDTHFALRVADFEASVIRLERAGFAEGRAVDAPGCMIVKRRGNAGFPQIFVCDPDGHVVEINGAPAG